MSEILLWLGITIGFVILFGICIVLAVMRKSVKLAILSVAMVLLSMAAGSVAAYKFLNKSYDVLQEAAAPRTGTEIYAAAFGQAETDCIRIIGFYEPSVYLSGSRLLLCFGACPAEVKRILSQHRYEVVKRQRYQVLDIADHSCCINYFTYERFGDTVLECMASSKADSYTLYLSEDSTHAYYIATRN
jgi:hypothetical protein